MGTYIVTRLQEYFEPDGRPQLPKLDLPAPRHYSDRLVEVSATIVRSGQVLLPTKINRSTFEVGLNLSHGTQVLAIATYEEGTERDPVKDAIWEFHGGEYPVRWYIFEHRPEWTVYEVSGLEWKAIKTLVIGSKVYPHRFDNETKQLIFETPMQENFTLYIQFEVGD